MNLIQRVGARLLGLRRIDMAPVEAAQVFSIRDGDTLVFSVDKPLPRHALEYMREQLQQEVRGARVIVLEGGLRVGAVLRREVAVEPDDAA